MSIKLITVPGIPYVREGDDLVELIDYGMTRGNIRPQGGDVFVLAQKIVSKAEGRLVKLETVKPGPRAIQVAKTVERDSRLVELILSESVNIVAMRPGLLLVEHVLGFVMPNAGIDQSNVEAGYALLLPKDPDGSALALRAQLSRKFGFPVSVIINDSVSRAWRAGTCGVAIGAAGLPTLNDLRGQRDMLGRTLQFSITGYADEIASAASLVMGQAAEGIPVVIVRGLKLKGSGTAGETLMPPSRVSPELVVEI